MKSHPHRSLLALSCVLLSVCWVAAAENDDQLDDLISNEQKALDTWSESADAPPPVFLIGTDEAALIYSSALLDNTENELCHDPSLDELTVGADDDQWITNVPVNLLNADVRERFGEQCLVRPGDQVVAVGRGQQDFATIARFELRPEEQKCPTDARAGIWAVYDEVLPEPPLFLSTRVDLSSGTNDFVPFELWIPTSSPRELPSLIRSAMKFSDEYDHRVFLASAPNVAQWIFLKKKTISRDDDGLPGEALAYRQDNRVEIVASVDIDVRHGSGRLNVVGSLDYNRDGMVDVVVDGYQSTCAFRLFFEGTASGLQEIRMPNKRCRC